MLIIVCFFTAISASEGNTQLMGDKQTEWTNGKVSASKIPLDIWNNIISHMNTRIDLVIPVMSISEDYKKSICFSEENLKKSGKYYGRLAIQSLNNALSLQYLDNKPVDIEKLSFIPPESNIFNDKIKKYEKISDLAYAKINLHYNSFILKNCTEYFINVGHSRVLTPDLPLILETISDKRKMLKLTMEYEETDFSLNDINYNLKFFEKDDNKAIKISDIPLLENGSIDEEKFKTLVDYLLEKYKSVTRLIYEKDTKCPKNSYQIPIIQNSKGDTILHEAIKENLELGAIETILNNHSEKGSILNVKDFKGYTPLILAIDKNMIDLVGKLLELGADVEISDNDLNTPLHHAVDKSYEIVELLLKKNASAHVFNIFFRTPLLKYCEKSNGSADFIKILKALLKANSNPNQKQDFDGYALMQEGYHAPVPLCNLLTRGRKAATPKEVKMLLKAGADPNEFYIKTLCKTSRDGLNQIQKYKISLLNEAMDHYDIDIIKLLLEYGATPDNQSLASAIRRKSVSLLDLLIKHGLDEKLLEKYNEKSWVVAYGQGKYAKAKGILWWEKNGGAVRNGIKYFAWLVISMSILFIPTKNRVAKGIKITTSVMLSAVFSFLVLCDVLKMIDEKQ